MISKNKKKGKSKMSKAEQENRIVVDHVYKTFIRKSEFMVAFLF